MAKILFYGGCHAKSLSDIFNIFGPPNLESQYITNFKLMDSNEEFPYDELIGMDAVFFTPIRSDTKYNTQNLINFCDRNSIKNYSFPWIQWNGYFPGITKRSPHNRLGEWSYRKLVPPITFDEEFESFSQKFLTTPEDHESVRREASKWLEVLRKRERDDNVDVIISDIIDSCYRTERLFFTPDHPSTKLYTRLARRLAEKAGLKLEDSFYDSTHEFHPELKIPILPVVRDALNLTFRDTECFNRYKSPLPISFIDFIKMEYYSTGNKTLLKCINPTVGKNRPIVSKDLSSEEKYEFINGDLIAGHLSEDDGSHILINSDEIWSKRRSRFIKFSRKIYLFKNHWTLD